jgi:hypothetical protein
MATRAHEKAPLDVLLMALPSLPRPVLSRLVARAIDYLDEIDGDPDFEDSDEDEGVEDGPFDPEEDYGAEELGEDARGGDVCEDLRPIADPQAYREHRERLRRSRCFPVQRVRAQSWGYQARYLRVEPVVPSKRQLLRRKRGMPSRPRP